MKTESAGQNRELWNEAKRTRLQVKNDPDGLDWARKILARLADGEKMPFRSLQLAREALGLPVEREPGED